jgi:hypothetical protein
MGRRKECNHSGDHEPYTCEVVELEKQRAGEIAKRDGIKLFSNDGPDDVFTSDGEETAHEAITPDGPAVYESGFTNSGVHDA